MTKKTILSTALLSLVCVSIIACDGNSSRKGVAEKVAITQDTSLEMNLEKLQEKVKAEEGALNSTLQDSENTHLAVLDAQKNFEEAMNNLQGNDDSDLAVVDEARLALDDAKAIDKEVRNEIEAMKINIKGLNKLIEKNKAQIRVRDNSKILDSLEMDDKKAYNQKIKDDMKIIEDIDNAITPDFGSGTL